ncbi:MAG TPA: hypothetical protein VI432_01590 [Candidatus Paceibacterota bacterium]
MQTLEFLVPEFEPRRKGAKWYLIFVFIIGLLILFSYFTKNPTFIGLIIIGAIFIIFNNNRRPLMMPLKISDIGIALGNKMWEFGEINSFSIYQIGNRNYFIFLPKGRFKNFIKVPVSKPEEIKSRLNNLITEVEYNESLIEIISRAIGL